MPASSACAGPLGAGHRAAHPSLYWLVIRVLRQEAPQSEWPNTLGACQTPDGGPRLYAGRDVSAMQPFRAQALSKAGAAVGGHSAWIAACARAS